MNKKCFENMSLIARFSKKKLKIYVKSFLEKNVYVT